MKRILNFFYLLLFAVMLLVPQNGKTCASSSEAVFFYSQHPGAPLKDYARGNLGVVLPQFEYPYLVIAYRYFSGRPLNPAEMNEALQFWRWELQSPSQAIQRDSVAEAWVNARALVAGKQETPPKINPDREFEDYRYYRNCLPDAFNNAALTLKDRIQRFGATSPEVREWTQGQDMVFSNCAGGRAIPAGLSQAAPQWLRADREYQIASANFYSEAFNDAAHQFDIISAQKNSPWHTIAPYLAARAVIRKATLIRGRGTGGEPQPLDAAALREAQARLIKLTQDPQGKDLQASARKLLAFVALRADPQARLHELAKMLGGTAPDPAFSQDLIDYDYGVRNLPRNAAVNSNDDLTDWLLNVSDNGDAATQEAVTRWRKHRSLPWLFAAISKVKVNSNAVKELAEAAARIPLTSPAYLSLSYQRIRLLMAGGQRDLALTLTNQVLTHVEKTITPTSLNLFLMQRMQLATSFPDFVSHAAFEVIEIDTYDGTSWHGYCPPPACPDVINTRPLSDVGRRFSFESALVLNTRIPLDLLKQGALGPELPEKQRYQLAAATWTRAVLLKDYQTADGLVATVSKGFPDTADRLKNFSTAPAPEEKWRAAIFAMLHLPGLRPYADFGLGRGLPIAEMDHYRDNWWCAGLHTVTETQQDEDATESPKSAQPVSPPPPFLSDQQAADARAQWKLLAALDAGPNLLTQQVLNWAKESPGDPRIPEALHFAVRSTRYGCVNHQTTKLSKKAFEVLHKRYPNSKWTRQTPYWF